MLRLTIERDAVLLPVKVVPGASRTGYLGEWDGRARIAVAVPAEKGKANNALVKFLADLLGVHRRDISVTAGHTTPLKTIRIERVTAEAIHAALRPTRS